MDVPYGKAFVRVVLVSFFSSVGKLKILFLVQDLGLGLGLGLGLVLLLMLFLMLFVCFMYFDVSVFCFFFFLVLLCVDTCVLFLLVCQTSDGGRGEALIRPSSKGPDHLSLSWMWMEDEFMHTDIQVTYYCYY